MEHCKTLHFLEIFHFHISSDFFFGEIPTFFENSQNKSIEIRRLFMYTDNKLILYLFLCVQDVFIFDTGKECFVWVGTDASPAEKKNGMSYAHVCIQYNFC